MEGISGLTTETFPKLINKKSQEAERNSSGSQRNLMNALTPQKRKLGRTWRLRQQKHERKIQVQTLGDDAVLRNLAQWLKSRGLERLQQARLRPAVFSDTGRGLMALEEIKEGDVLVSIPREALVTSGDVYRCKDLGDALRSVAPRLRAMDVLTLFLLYNKHLGKHSSWQPYLNSLPESYTVPLFCTSDEIRFLPKFIADSYELQNEDVRKCFDSIRDVFELVVDKNVLTYDSVRWGWFTVNTRAVYLQEQSNVEPPIKNNIYALAPFLDLLNHCPGVQVTTGLNSSNNCYEITTQASYKPYQQVFINYGPHDNIKLYTEYGFSVPNNPHNSVQVTLDRVKTVVATLADVDERRTCNVYEKCRILRDNNLDTGLAVHSEGITWSLAVVLTVLLMNEDELVHWRVVYEDVEVVSHRQIVLQAMEALVRHELQYMCNCLEAMDDIGECSDAFGACKVLVRDCCDVLQSALRSFVI